MSGATQRDAVAVLAELAALDLPPLSWTVHPWQDAGLEAQPWARDAADDADDQAQRLAALDEWAAHLGTRVAVRDRSTHISHEVRAMVRGVKVRIFTLTGQTTELMSVPLDQVEQVRATLTAPGSTGGAGCDA